MRKNLKGQKVLITRAAHQADSLIKLVESHGGEPIAFPMIAIREISQTDKIELALKQLEIYDWIVFTSVNAVKYFFSYAERFQVRFYFYPNLKIATVGEKTKMFLEQLGFRTNFVPIEYRAEVLAVNMDESIEGKRVLIPRSSKANDDYIRVFEKRKAIVDSLIVYQNQEVQYSKEELITLQEKLVDSIAFTSPSSIKAMVNNFKNNDLPFPQAKVYCIGPSTAAEAKNQGLEVSGVASPHTVEGLIETLSK